MKKFFNIFMVAVLAVLVLNDTAVAAAPSFDSPIDGPSRLTLILPRGNPYDEAPAAPLDGYTVTVSAVENLDVTSPLGYEQARSMTYEDTRGQTLTEVAKQVTGPDGVLVFHGLKPALYVVETVAAQGRTGAAEINPVTVVLPGVNEDGSWAYGVTLTLKRGIAEEPTPPSEIPDPEPPPSVPPTPNDPPKPPLARTGVELSALAALAVAGLAVGVVLVAKRNEDDGA